MLAYSGSRPNIEPSGSPARSLIPGRRPGARKWDASWSRARAPPGRTQCGAEQRPERQPQPPRDQPPARARGDRARQQARPRRPSPGRAQPHGADSATRGGLLSLRRPRFSRTRPSAAAEPVSPFRRSGCEKQAESPRRRAAVQRGRSPEATKTTVPSPGSVGAMNNAGEALPFPAEVLPGGSGWARRPGGREEPGMELFGRAGAAWSEAAAWGRTLVKGFSAAVVTSGGSWELRARVWESRIGLLQCSDPISSSNRTEFGEGSCSDSETEFRPPVRTCSECRDHPRPAGHLFEEGHGTECSACVPARCASGRQACHQPEELR